MSNWYSWLSLFDCVLSMFENAATKNITQNKPEMAKRTIFELADLLLVTCYLLEVLEICQYIAADKLNLSLSEAIP